MFGPIRRHWPEYLMEAAGLGIFMISAGVFTILFEYPGSPVHQALPSGFIRRCLIGLAMGLTAVGIIYSHWGKRSGAHLNPAVTLSFLWLKKIQPWDAFYYIAAQFAGGLAGVLLVKILFPQAFQVPEVAYAATVPGPGGAWLAFFAEAAISFGLMLTVLSVSSQPRFNKLTGVFAGCLVALYIAFEAPFSGMSMNPARTFASALPGGIWKDVWVYFTAPFVGMLAAVEVSHLWVEAHHPCPKLGHSHHHRCIFCGLHMHHQVNTTTTATTAKAIIVLLVLLGAGSITADAQIKQVGMGPIVQTVSDLDRSVEFYSKVLSFQKESEHDARLESFDHLTGVFGTNTRVATMRLGNERLQLIQWVAPEGRPLPATSRAEDGWFQHIAIVVSNMEQAYAVLKQNKVRQISTEPQTLPMSNPAAGGVKAFYFHDPDNHSLELIYFPPGKGDPKWQGGKTTFLGIDHSAIAVSDSDRSAEFYVGILGLHVTGESLNFGIEQEHLNHVFGSRVRITGLRGPTGPGIEFLQYIVPTDGRPMPADSQPNDLWYWNTTVLVNDVPGSVAELRKRKVKFVSSEPESVEPLAEKEKQGILIRDPDGHAILVRSN
jgi:MIP family channel proteins